MSESRVTLARRFYQPRFITPTQQRYVLKLKQLKTFTEFLQTTTETFAEKLHLPPTCIAGVQQHFKRIINL